MSNKVVKEFRSFGELAQYVRFEESKNKGGLKPKKLQSTKKLVSSDVPVTPSRRIRPGL